MAEGSLSTKLRMKSGQRIALIKAPTGFEDTLRSQLRSATVETRLDGRYDVVQAFYTHQSDLDAVLPALKSALRFKVR